MKFFSTLALVGVAGALFASTAVAQQRTSPGSEPWSPPPGMGAGMPSSGYNYDLWSYMSVKNADENVLRIVDKAGWSRARQAAAAINGGRCGEAAVIAASANDTRLMEGVKRACKAL